MSHQFNKTNVKKVEASKFYLGAVKGDSEEDLEDLDED